MKLVVNMLSKADSVEGQGVGSAYLEQVNLIKTELADDFEVRINSKKKADILHVHSINLPFYFRFKKKNGIRVMYCHFLPETFDGSISLPRPIFWCFKKYFLKFYRKADYLVVVNPSFKKDLVRYKVKEDRIVYIPNFVSKENFYEMEKEERLKIREEYNIPKDKFVVLGCGQVQTRKGVMDFVEIAKKNPQIEFVWCGGFSFSVISDGHHDLKKIMDNPPCDNLKFLGIIPRKDMNKMFNMADMLFMPSYNELFPMSILEAVSCGKPVVLRNLDLYKDILWDKPIYGENNEDFSNAINKLATDSSYYNEAKLKSEDVAKFYSKEHVAELWKEFYQGIYNKKLEEKNKKKK